ncbi:MAG TPA: AAA family ATPase [Treponemataceae bacterium]|jgi:MoxR-like ATPase|nr:AAA family ATPase [Treponemataceae bacterium]
MTTQDTGSALVAGLSGIIRGKAPQIELFVACYLSGGHVLIEDAPGLGKTTLAKALARLVGDGSGAARFARIQCTPDLLPYDITGVDVFNAGEGRFSFVPGPIFTDILLADEINRATPKVQSALLEVMAERQVSSGGVTRRVGDCFFVVATQNPVESEGTYPLPAAQLDRFMVRLALGYPDEEAEVTVIHDDPAELLLPRLEPVVPLDAIRASRAEQLEVYCHPDLERAIVRLVRATRERGDIKLGASPRAALHLLHVARALALMRGRDWVEDQDVIDVAPAGIAHRLVPFDPRTDCVSLARSLALSVFADLDRASARERRRPGP